MIYELFTGRILFPGRTNNEMLKLMMDAKGPFPKKMLKKGEFTPQHFEDDPAMSFCLLEIDPLTKLPVRFSSSRMNNLDVILLYLHFISFVSY